MSDEQKNISVEDLVSDDLINCEYFSELLKAIEEKKRILLVGQPGAHGLATLATTLLIHGDTKEFKYEIFDAELMKNRKGKAAQYLAHLCSKADVYGLLSLWAQGDGGVATIYAESVRDAMDKLEYALKEQKISDPTAFINCTVDVICMVENEDSTCQNSVIRDVIVVHH